MKKYRVGVDLGGTNIAVGVIDESFHIIGRGKMKTNAPRPAEEIIADIVKAICLALEDANLTKEQILSVGIGTPGTVNRQTGVVEFSNNLQFHKLPMVAMLKELLDVPYAIENDANAAALGEALAGAGKGKQSFVAVTLGTGVGGGIIWNGEVISGCNGAGGELGHMVICVDGEPCNCGRKGCWEQYASATALVRQTKAAMLAHPESEMWKLCDGSLENAGGRTAFDAMRKGDPVGTEVVNAYIRYVAAGTTNIVNALQPEIICFGGGISNEGETLLAPLRAIIETERYTRYSEVQTQICKATLGNDAGIIGAALLNA